MAKSFIRGAGARVSPKDLRTFAYKPNYTTSPVKVGERWSREYIRDQSKVGICTSIALTQQATRHFGIEMSPEWLYLLQSTIYDDWDEGSSIFHALKAATTYGFLPASEMDKWVKAKDRDLTYARYTKKLQAIPAKEIERLKEIAANYKLSGYYSVPFNWDVVKHAIAESKFGVLARFELGSEWYTALNGKTSWKKEDLEPLRRPTPATLQSGHAVTISNADGGSWRIANSWGVEWCDEGTAYSRWESYPPTECWLPVFPDTEKEDEVLNERQKLEASLRNALIELIKRLSSLINGK